MFNGNSKSLNKMLYSVGRLKNMILGQRWTLMTQCFNMLKLMRLLWIVWEQGYKLSFYSAPERVGFVKLSFWIKELWICGKGKKKKKKKIKRYFTGQWEIYDWKSFESLYNKAKKFCVWYWNILVFIYLKINLSMRSNRRGWEIECKFDAR